VAVGQDNPWVMTGRLRMTCCRGIGKRPKTGRSTSSDKSPKPTPHTNVLPGQSRQDDRSHPARRQLNSAAVQAGCLRLWRSFKYEEVYLKAYSSLAEARASIGHYLNLCNRNRPRSNLGARTPDQAYLDHLPQAAARYSFNIETVQWPLDRSRTWRMAP
jgi:hypothetical protein